MEEKKALTPEEYIEQESFIMDFQDFILKEDALTALEMLRSSHKEEMESLYREMVEGSNSKSDVLRIFRTYIK